MGIDRDSCTCLSLVVTFLEATFLVSAGVGFDETIGIAKKAAAINTKWAIFFCFILLIICWALWFFAAKSRRMTKRIAKEDLSFMWQLLEPR